jgi:hypothetical protein
MAEPVVGEVESEADPLDPFDQQVHRLGRYIFGDAAAVIVLEVSATRAPQCWTQAA